MNDNRKKILIIGPEPPSLIGGIASYIVFQLSSQWLSEKYRMICLDTSLTPGLRANKLTRLTGSIWLTLRLLVLLAIQRPSVVHIHSSSRLSFWEKGLFILASRLFRSSAVMHVHGSDFDSFYRESHLKTLIGFILNRADSVVILSSYWKKFFGSITTSRLDVIPNCPNIEFFDSTVDVGRGRAVVFTGSVGPRKGVDVLLEATALLRARDVDSPVILAGGEEVVGGLDSYRNLVSDKKLGDVVFRGNVDPAGLRELFSEAAVFCLPSRAEGLPIAMLEAMAAGLPVVTTPVGGIPDAIEDGVNGFIVPVGDSRMLAEKLELLLNDSEMCKRMGEANQRKAREYYHPQVTSQALIDLYESITSP